MLRATLIILASSVFSLGIGFVKNILAAYYFGTSGAMDAYLLALLVPDAAMHLAQTGVFNFVPLFAAARARSEAEAWGAAGKMLTYWLLLLVGAVLVALLFLPQVVTLVAPGFAGERRAIAVELTRTLLLMAVFVGAARVLAVTLQAERRFLMAGVSEGVFQAASTLYLIAFHGSGIGALVWGQVFGGMCQLLVVAIALWDRRRDIRASLDLSSAPVRRMIRLTLPVYLGESGSKLNLIVTRAFATILPAGAVSSLQYALTLVDTLPALVVGALTTALFPFLSQGYAGSDPREARERLGRALNTTLFLFTPLAAGLWLLATPLVVAFWQRGSFDAESTELTATALRIFAPATLALALNALLVSAFHALQDTATPMKAGFLRTASNMALCATLVPFLGYEGVAIAITASTYVKLAYLLCFSHSLFAAADLWQALRTFARLLPAVAAMAAVVYPLDAWLAPNRYADVAAFGMVAGLALVGAATYLAAVWIVWRREFLDHAGAVARALSRRHGPGEAARPPAVHALGTREEARV